MPRERRLGRSSKVVWRLQPSDRATVDRTSILNGRTCSNDEFCTANHETG